MKPFWKRNGAPSIAASQREEFYTLMASFINDGIPLFDSLQVLDEQFRKTRDRRHAITAKAMRRLRGEEQKTHAFTLGQALRDLVPPVEATMIDAGEQGADPIGGLTRAAQIATDVALIRSKVTGGIVTPVFYFLMLCALLAGISQFAIPVMESVAPRERWAGPAAALGWLADHIILLTVFIAASVGGWSGAFLATRDHWTGETRRFFDRYVFPWTLHRRISSVVYLKAISSFMRVGVPMVSAIDMLSDTSGAWGRAHFRRMKRSARDGTQEGRALATGLFEQGLRWQIVLYGSTSNFAVGLERLAVRFMAKTIAKTEAQFRTLGILIMAIVAIMVVWVYGSFMMVTFAVRSGNNF
ncbi:type II secretion system F family protein [Noviherbaspirillum galbum]|uniref:Type II secretion system protein GspF domain-containing protein n=1 Tax=Noviherbaspirillum galbum TaxID=2709383 RepID=A0A6B3SVH2_9BURK|nr:type II secretion system F family protein [Noviherbaspirillum galbum]NEX64528.1 hypothetical protein [Noviherbaspirillum galbum]